MRALLDGTTDAEPAVCASCLACLARVAATLGPALHPWAVELMRAAEAHLIAEPRFGADAQAQQAAAHLIASLLVRLGRDALALLSPAQLRPIYRRLRVLRDGAPDALTREHAAAAVDALDALGSALLGSDRQSAGRVLAIRMP